MARIWRVLDHGATTVVGGVSATVLLTTWTLPDAVIQRVVMLVSGTGLGALGLIRAERRRAAAVQATQEEKKSRASAEELAAQYVSRYIVTLGDVVIPIAYLLAQIAGGPARKRRERKQLLVQLVVDTAVRMCGPPDGVRATYFGMRGTVMRFVSYSGRHDPPKTIFRGTEPRGSQAVQLVKEHRCLLVADTAKAPAGVEIRPDAPYRCFLSTSVFAA